MTARKYAASDRIAAQRYRARYFVNPSQLMVVNIAVPEDVERFDYVPEPCFKCGVRRGCRHRPWMLAL